MVRLRERGLCLRDLPGTLFASGCGTVHITYAQYNSHMPFTVVVYSRTYRIHALTLALGEHGKGSKLDKQVL